MVETDLSLKVLSDITVFNKYARYLPELKRRETWEEIIDRNKTMHINKYPDLKDEINEAYKFVYNKKILPSMRSLQFAGKPIELNNSRIYNCAYLPIDHYKSFSETMFLLLSGCGVGYSVQFAHIAKLPEIRKPIKTKRYIVEDSIIGWAEAIRVLVKSYFSGNSKPTFDFSDIRPKGALLVTSGGKAPGAAPLKKCLFDIEQILDTKNNGEKLSSIECHSILCHIADGVLAGGIRRSAMIAGFSFDDEQMIGCKSGNWWETNPHFARANNSAVIVRNRCTEDEFNLFWDRIKASGAGEPGISWTNNPEYFFNPCHEISLRPYSFCNLVEINGGNVESQDDFNDRCKAAATIATLQASYTDFVYLRDVWKQHTEKDALIGVGITGIASNTIDNAWLKPATKLIKSTNQILAARLNINKAARCTTIKPSGTTSCVLGTSSGIHAWYNDFYIRRLRVGKNESLYTYLSIYFPDLIEDEIFKPNEQAVLSLPIKAPKGAILRNEDNIDFLERVKTYNIDWVQAGHRSGPNYNNVSTTVSIKDDEWEKVGTWMWENRDTYSGIAVLPYHGGNYKQTPFEDCTEEQYNEMSKHLAKIDLTLVSENENNVNLQAELACQGNNCEVL
jgi:ribonucleoside-diphosphate reductase alpha chain